MKKRHLWKAFALFCFSISGHYSIGQVTDPSETNLNYDQQKQQQIVHQVQDSRRVIDERRVEQKEPAPSGANRNSDCFIPLDAGFTAIPRNDDGSFGPIALPFTFDLYGASYNQVWINTNGNLTFNGPFSTFSPSGFPFNVPMVAPFWGDVDTRNTQGGQIHYKVSGTNLIVTWDGVGYYNQKVDKLNTFQVVISDGFDPITGLGQNVCFNFGDMNWTTGDASNGIGGFGGFPATVGANKGDGVDFFQIGRFGENSSAYDGPGGNTDGVHYMDFQCFCAQTSLQSNIPPVATNFPTNDTIVIACGDTYTLDFSFIPPEVNQNVSTSVNTGGLCGTSFTATSGSISNVSFSIDGQTCNEGTHTISFTGTDDGTPSESTTVSLTIVVETCCNVGASAIGTDQSCPNTNDGTIIVTAIDGTAPYQYSIDGGATFVSTEIFNGLVAGTYSVVVADANGCLTDPQDVIVGVTPDVIPPVIMDCPTNIIVTASNSTCEEAVSWAAPSAIDNCLLSSLTGSHNSGDVFALGTTTVTYTATDASGNDSMCSFDVTVLPQPITLAASSSVYNCGFGVSCHGATDGSASVTASGGCGTLSYQWDNGMSGATINGLGAGSYTVTVTDEAGNQMSETVVISEPAPINGNVSPQNVTIDCTSGPVAVGTNPTGGCAPYTYAWSNGATTQTISVTPDVTTTYTVVITDANGCTAAPGTNEMTVNVIQDTIPPVISGCPVDITVTATNSNCAEAVSWNAPTASDNCLLSSLTGSHNSGDVFPLGTTTITYTATDDAGNSSICSFNVTVLAQPITISTTTSAYNCGFGVSCHGATDGSATATASGGCGTLSYQWDNGMPGATINGLAAGSYVVTITDDAGNQVSETVVITEPAAILGNVTPQGGTIDCIPNPLTLTANPTGGCAPYTYLWSTGETTQSISVNPNVTTTYSVVITDANGCTAVQGSNETTVNVINRCGNNNQKVVICHVPHGNQGNPQTICISPNALSPHLSTMWDLHGGDYCGPCVSNKDLTLGSTDLGDNAFMNAAPNPFNNSTKMEFRLAYDSNVKVEVYTMNGQLVDVVYEEAASEGVLYTFDIDATKWTSGVYVYKFITDRETHIDKLQKVD